MIARALIKDKGGSSAVEFALVLPLLLIFLLGIIDAGRFLWEYNQAEKATQVGARVAVVTNVIPGGMVGTQYVGVSGLTQGDRIPASALGTLSCSRTSCSCTGTCPATGTINTAAFDYIVLRMRNVDPNINAANVRVEYRGSGLGFAGDPDTTKPQVSPLVTVSLSATPAATALRFTPITSLLFATFTMPSFSTTLTAEDLSGNQSN